MDNYPYMIVMFLFGVYDAVICRLFFLPLTTAKMDGSRMNMGFCSHGFGITKDDGGCI